ncbi:UNVERIFIED_CONTAM: hypothetical protein GTU68_010636, partial [Idotea baltica]|nr:hypothetical protein [Idotea baltica]
MQISLQKYILPLKYTFSISRESHDYQNTLIVSLSLHGHTGYGEATSNPYYKITVESMISEIEAIQMEVEDFDFTTPEILHEFLVAKGLTNFAICAMDLAAHDLYGKLAGKPLYEIWNTNTEYYPTTNYTIGIAPVEKMVAKMKEFPWPIYKIKLGTEIDVAIVKELRNHTDAIFRIDANCAWTPKETITNAPLLKELGVEFM